MELFPIQPSNEGLTHVKTNLATTGTGILAAALLTLAAAAPANATPSEDPAELIQRVAPMQGDVVPLQQDAAAVFTAPTASIPADPAAPITVHGGEGVELPVSIPSQLQVTPPTASADGTIVYASEADGVDFATQVLDNGIVRMQTILSSPDDPHSFTYELGNGFIPAEAADGSLWAYRFNDAGEIEMFGIGEAWARDANGADVPTHYEVTGNTLTQVVEPAADAAYPIVADPTWQWYNAAYGAGFSKQETKDLASAGAITGFCTALGKTPPLAAACAIAGAQWFLQAGLAANANECVFIAAVPAPLAVRWISNECR